MAKEENDRRKALELHAQGVKVAEIARRMGRSRQWVYKWIGRHDVSESGWSKSRPRAPQSRPGKVPLTVEEQVAATRIELDRSPHMESGAYAIWHRMAETGQAPPSVATINRILKRHGLVRAKKRYVKSGIDYPEASLNTQIMDLIGPCYLRGGSRFYLLNIISNDTRHAGVYPIRSKSAADVTRAVTDFWKAYSVPDFLQLDNELSFKGSNRHPRSLGLLMRTALAQGVTPVFIPVSEPWRNGVIERFNQKVESTLLRQEHSSFEELLEHAHEFSETHNRSHHYSTFGHKTPLELDDEIGLPAVPLDPGYVVGEKPPLDSGKPNEIHFVRLVRSDLRINVLNTAVEVLPELSHTYVTAMLLVNEHTLVIRQGGKNYQWIPFAMPVI